MDLSIARKHIEKLYVDTCNIYEYQKVRDPDDGSTNVEEVLAYENVPCKLSYENISHATEGLGDNLFQVTKLIVNPEITIKAGSRIIVTRNNRLLVYRNSGESAIFLNHQEVKLELEEERA